MITIMCSLAAAGLALVAVLLPAALARSHRKDRDKNRQP